MLSPRLPELAAFAVLVQVAESGSLNAAGEALGVTQQAVSARISAIEAQTGVRLVTRTPRGSVLTPAGLVVVEWAHRLIELAGQVDTGIAALRETRQATLRVGASHTVAEQFLPGWLVALQQRSARADRPPVEVVLEVANSSVVAQHVRDGDIDLGFVEGPSAPSGLHARAVGRDRLVVVVPPGHAWARRAAPLSPAELATTPLVTREEGSGTRDVLLAALRASLGPAAETAPPTLALPTTAGIRAAVVAGAGPAVLSELAVADDLAAGRLLTVPVDGLDLDRSLRAIWSGPRALVAGPARDLVALATR